MLSTLSPEENLRKVQKLIAATYHNGAKIQYCKTAVEISFASWLTKQPYDFISIARTGNHVIDIVEESANEGDASFLIIKIIYFSVYFP